MGSATVSEHFPRQEISLIATTRFCKLFHSLFRTKTFKRTNFAVRLTGGAYISAEKHRAVAKRIGFDPAVMASPFITTIVDALSLIVYFNFASILLHLG